MSEHRIQAVQPSSPRRVETKGQSNLRTAEYAAVSAGVPDRRTAYITTQENGEILLHLRPEKGDTRVYRKKEYDDVLRAAIDKKNRQMAEQRRELRFEFHQEANMCQVKVIDTSKQETDPARVVRQIPPEGTIKFIEEIREMVGILLDIEI